MNSDALQNLAIVAVAIGTILNSVARQHRVSGPWYT